MMSKLLRRFVPLAAIAGCAVVPNFAHAQTIELRAMINASQEVPATTSPATGTGIMLYNVASNTFDLFVTLDRYSNPMTDSHVQEAPAGENGPALIHFGAESVYTRNGSSVTAAFLNRPYPGSKLKLLQSGAYLNFHSPQFPLGEVRGQLIARPKRLVANFTVAQEQAAFPATPITSSAYGAAIMLYDPAANRMSLRLSLFNYANTLTNSHFHEGAAGVSGPVVVGLGAGTVSGYTNHGNGYWTGTFDLPYTGGDPIQLLTGGAYLNFHSSVFPNGETRGQVVPSEEVAATRVTNSAARGFVGPGAQTLVAGITINGPEPVRVLITARGPSLTAFGIGSVLADPTLSVYDAAGRQIALNDNFGAVPAGSELARIPGLPTNPSESALVLVLPPGNYTALVSGANNTTGIALIEVADLRTLGGLVTN
jgi:hypothetical protein